MIFYSISGNSFEVVQFNNLDKKEESSVKQAKLANIDFRQKENNVQVGISFLIV